MTYEVKKRTTFENTSTPPSSLSDPHTPPVEDLDMIYGVDGVYRVYSFIISHTPGQFQKFVAIFDIDGAADALSIPCNVISSRGCWRKKSSTPP